MRTTKLLAVALIALLPFGAFAAQTGTHHKKTHHKTSHHKVVHHKHAHHKHAMHKAV